MGSDSEGNLVKLEPKSDEDEKPIGSLFKVRKSRVSLRKKSLLPQVSQIRVDAQVEGNPKEEETSSGEINDTLAVIKKKLNRPKSAKIADLVGSVVKPELISDELEKKEINSDPESVKSSNKRARLDFKLEEQAKEDLPVREILTGSENLVLEDSLLLLFKKSRKTKNSNKVTEKLEEESEKTIKSEDSNLIVKEENCTEILSIGLTRCSNEVMSFTESPILALETPPTKTLLEEINNSSQKEEKNDLSKEENTEPIIISEIKDEEKIDSINGNNNNNNNLFDEGICETNMVPEIKDLENFDTPEPINNKNTKIINNNNSETEKKILGSPDSTRAEADDLSPTHNSEKQQTECENKEKVSKTRNIKKRRHDDMAYEGDADWEIMNNNHNEQVLFNNNNLKLIKEEVLNGRVGAVRAGLKAKTILPIEKIRFKDLLKRKGGLPEYLECRNMILGRWSKDVKHILTLTSCGVTDNPCENESPREALIREIYLFLDQNGYINAGIASPTKEENTQFIKPDPNPITQKKIIIIGAGPAGISAARHLSRQGFSVTILEARDRIGGRVHTDHSSLSVPVDLGASIITGVEADLATERPPDPSSLICSQLGLELTVLNSDCPLYDVITGEMVPPDLDQALESEYNSLLDEMVLLVAQEGDNAANLSLEYGLELGLRKHRENEMERNGGDDVLTPMERRVMNWHFAHLEYGCATMLKEVSLPHWNQDDVYGGFGGAHCMIKGGFSTVIESLSNGLDLRLSRVVNEIIYDEDKVQVKAMDGDEFEGDAVLVTIPLGCLKDNSIKFSPELPNWKVEAIKRLGFGVLNKVVLEFPSVFWDENVDYFGATAEDSDSRGKCFMFWNVKKTVNANILIALVAGKAAIDGEKLTDEEHVNHALSILRKIYGDGSVPDPIGSVVTNWGSEPFTRGSYSYVSIGATGEDYDILGKPVNNKVFFAGEATCKEHPDTVGGAMLSGVREAVRMINVLTHGRDFVVEIEAAEAGFKKMDLGRNEAREFARRMESGVGSGVLREMFFGAKTTSGRLFLVKELLRVSVDDVKGFAGSKDGLSTLNSWILDSLGKNATQLLRHCVRLLVLVSTDLVAVRLSGIGRTIKEKVCMHTSRDIRAIASQLVKVWIEVFRREKASKKAMTPIPKISKKSENKPESEASSFKSQRTNRGFDSDHDRNPPVMSEEEAAAFAAAEAARAAAIAAAEAYASREAENASLELPKIPSFHKFANRLNTDEPDLKKKHQLVNEIQNQNPETNSEILEISNPSSNSYAGEEIRFAKAWVDVEATGVDGVKDASAIERWQAQAFEADKEFYSKLRIPPPAPPEQDKDKEKEVVAVVAPAENVKTEKKTGGGSSASKVNSEGKPPERVKQGILDYVASLLMPLYKTRKLDRDGYKSIMKKAVTKVMEQSSEAEKAMAASEFLDSKRKNKIRALVDRLIERQLQVKSS